MALQKSVALTESFIIGEASMAGFKTLSEKKSMDSDHLRDAINKERPFKELYQNIMWLNHYAITNIMAIEFALNKFQNNVFMAAPEFNLLNQNFMTVLNNTELKKNEDLSLSYLDDITRDLVRFYAIFFTKGDKKKAQEVLEQQSSIDAMALAKASFFFGCSIAVAVLILIEKFKHPLTGTSLFITQLYQFDSVIRFILMQTMVLFGAAVSIYVWKANHVNYMYIFQLDYGSVIFFIQFFKTAFLYLFIGLLFLYIFLNDAVDLFQRRGEIHDGNQGDQQLTPEEGNELLVLKRTYALPLCCLFVLIWVNPLNILQRSFRYGSIVALFNIVIAPFGNVQFKTYLLAEILTDCSIPILDLGRIVLYLSTDKWNSCPIKLSDE